jgi:hypothetical protein
VSARATGRWSQWRKSSPKAHFVNSYLLQSLTLRAVPFAISFHVIISSWFAWVCVHKWAENLKLTCYYFSFPYSKYPFQPDFVSKRSGKKILYHPICMTYHGVECPGVIHHISLSLYIYISLYTHTHTLVSRCLVNLGKWMILQENNLNMHDMLSSLDLSIQPNLTQNYIENCEIGMFLELSSQKLCYQEEIWSVIDNHQCEMRNSPNVLFRFNIFCWME